MWLITQLWLHVFLVFNFALASFEYEQLPRKASLSLHYRRRQSLGTRLQPCQMFIYVFLLYLFLFTFVILPKCLCRIRDCSPHYSVCVQSVFRVYADLNAHDQASCFPVVPQLIQKEKPFVLFLSIFKKLMFCIIWKTLSSLLFSSC